MRVLIIGSGGREHALAETFKRSDRVQKVYVSPGNGGIALDFECVELPSFEDIAEFYTKKGIDLVFIGPEQPIAEGLSDYLQEKGMRVVAPSRAAARLETSKAFAKDLMLKNEVPTAKYKIVHSLSEAKEILPQYGLPVVLKADGLAAGKGVIIAKTMPEAEAALEELLSQPCGESGVLVEEFLEGWEVSLFAFCDGKNYKTTLFAQDHKQLYDGDRGPNTGGMGAFAPVKEAEDYRQRIHKEILEPVLAAMVREGCPYKGVLYLGLMITAKGPCVVEFNCRFGDPETQALLPLLKTDLSEISLAIVEKRLDEVELQWEDKHCVAVVLAAEGYPGSYEKGIKLALPELKSQVFYAGVRKEGESLVSSGGRIMAFSAVAKDLAEAKAVAYQDIDKLKIENIIYRKDIGFRKNFIAKFGV